MHPSQWIPLTLALIVLLIAVFILAGLHSNLEGYTTLSFQGGENLIDNPGFEQDFESWSHSHFNSSICEGYETIETEGCFDGKCLKMVHGNCTWQGTSQTIGPLEVGEVYELAVWFNTSPFHYGYINLYDSDWKNITCDRVGRSFTKKVQGTNEWQRFARFVRIPAVDACGEPTTDHDWRVYLYGDEPQSDNSSVFYDTTSLIQLEDFNPQDYFELEEADGWLATCQFFSDGYPLTPCHGGFITHNYSEKVSGSFSLMLTGTREKRESYTIDVIVKPDTTYRVRAALRIADRAVYNYLNLPYPTIWVRQRPEIHDTVESTKGIWSGRYYLEVDGTSFLPNIIKDAEYRSPSDVDWFYEDSYFRTSSDEVVASINVKLEGFEGKLFIDNLTIQEVDSHIDAAYFHVPSTTEFKGMHIQTVAPDPLSVATSTAVFSFSDTVIELAKEQYISHLTFPPGFLQNLAVTQEEGNVVLENDNILLSVGADDVLIAKLKNSAQLHVEGERPSYRNFEGGVIFATDYTSGIIFSPLRTKKEVIGMNYHYNTSLPNYTYYDSDFESEGQKFWNLISGFDNPTWRVDYDLDAGGGFIAQVFPPKDFDITAYCKERICSLGADAIRYPDADFSYRLQKLGERATIGLVWMDDYAVSPNTQNPPDFYCKDSEGLLVHCDDPDVDRRIPVGIKFDVTGPYVVGEPEAFQRLVDAAHALGMKIIVYMSPNYYYTSDVDTFLQNLNELVTNYNIDGVYYDGMYRGETLRSLEMARKTRNMLGDKFYSQHISWESTLLRRTGAFRAPYLDVQADLIWNAEGMKFIDDDTWLLNYCGQNVSNTPSMVLAELRPVDYNADKETSISLSLSPEEQVDKTLACTGIFRTNPFYSTSGIHDKHFQHNILFETDYFWYQYDAFCLGYTCGDSVCDAGESFYTCPQDCTPYAENTLLVWEGDEYTCLTDDSVVQWVVDGEPFYALHFTFDDILVQDDSAHNMNPYPNVGITYQPPSHTVVDGRGVFTFNSSVHIFGDISPALNLSGQSFSVFAVVKSTQTSTNEERILTLTINESQSFGIKDGTLTAFLTDDYTPATAEIVTEGCVTGKCLKMQHNDATWQGTRQVVGTLTPGETYMLSAMFKTAPTHNGYINLYDSSWCGGSGSHTSPSMPGNNDWQEIDVEVTIPLEDDCGHSTAGHTWIVYLYGYVPREDNSPIYYDDVSLEYNSENLLSNPSFEDDFEDWVTSGYRPPTEVGGTKTINDQAWHSIGMVYERPTLSLYVDGEKDSETTIDLAGFSLSGTYIIGAVSPSDTTTNFNGYIDDLFVTDMELSEEQIEQYNDTLHKTLSFDGSGECVIRHGGTFFFASHCGNGVCEEGLETCETCTEDCGICPPPGNETNETDCEGDETRPCGTDVGVCEFGIQACVNGTWGSCEGGVGPGVEVCNQLDDDCNGVVDNVDGGDSVEAAACQCYGGNVPNATEVCNAIDDDCDGEVDGITRQCGPSEEQVNAPQGMCVFGTSVCSEGGWGECVGAVYAAEGDECGDEIDNDCDGEVDESCATCTDGVQNRDEEGVDCGGSCPNACFDPIGDFPFSHFIMFMLVVGGIVGAIAVMVKTLRGGKSSWETIHEKYKEEPVQV